MKSKIGSLWLGWSEILGLGVEFKIGLEMWELEEGLFFFNLGQFSRMWFGSVQ